MFLGENVIAQVWSFSNEMREVPYLIKIIKHHIAGHKWACNCPSFMYRKITCKHIRALRESAKIRFLSIDKRFNLSDLGTDVLLR